MFGIIFSLIILFLAILFVGVGLLRGRKYVWSFFALKCVAVILSAALSLLASIFLLPRLFKVLLPVSFKLPFLRSFQAVLADLPVVQEAVIALLSMLVAPFIFIALFFILKGILNSVALRISVKTIKNSDDFNIVQLKKETGKSKKNIRLDFIRTDGKNLRGMMFGAVCGFLLCFVILIPVVGSFTVVDHAMGVISSVSSNSAIETAERVSDGATNSVGFKTVRTLGGQAIYKSLTTYSVGGEKVSLLQETKFFATAAEAIGAVKNPDVSNSEAASKVITAKDTFAETELLPAVLPEVAGEAMDQWQNGKSFLGIKKPSFGGEANGLIEDTLSLMIDTDSTIVKKDVATISQVLAMMVEQDVLTEMKRKPLIAFEDEAFGSLVVYELLSNDHTSPLVGNIAELGIEMLNEKMNANITDISMDTSAISDKQYEAQAIARAMKDVSEIMNYMEVHPSVDAHTMQSFGNFLDSLALTQMAGQENSDRVLSGLMYSEKIYSGIGFSQDEAVNLAGSMNEKAHTVGYFPVMNSLGQTMDVMRLSGKTDTDNEEMDAKVEILLQDLIPESAALLQEAATASLMQKHGVSEQSAEPTANMISDMFGNLSNAKEQGMSDEEYKKEAKATSDLLNLAISAGKSQSGSTFGAESATGRSAAELLDNILDSKVISQTMVETVYANGTENAPVINPLNSGKNLQDSEKQDLLDAMNNKWNEATEAEKQSANYHHQYVAVGALMNISIQITDSGIVII